MKSLLPLFALLPIAAFAAPRAIEVGVKPESVCRGWDNALYVSMINGEEPGDGGINRVDKNGKVTAFCRGMNSPKGLAYLGGFLVTADETTVWKVDQQGVISKLAGKDDFPEPVEFLNDVAAGPEGKSVYVTEMTHPRHMFKPEGTRALWPLNSKEALKLSNRGCVFQVSLDGSITVAVPPQQWDMPGPNGVTASDWKGNRLLIMADFFTGNIVQWNGTTLKLIADGPRGADAVALDGPMIYVSSWTTGEVWAIDKRSGEHEVLLKGLTTAADFYHDKKNKQLIIPDMLAGKLVFLPLKK